MSDDPEQQAVMQPALDNLELRLAAFENATGRLQRTLGSETAATPQPRSSGSSASRLAQERLDLDPPSGLRPSVPSEAPTTGALTARRRSGESATAAQPGFTSAFGKPSIPLPAASPAALQPPAQPQPQRAAVKPGSAQHLRRAWPAWLRTRSVLAAAAVLAGLLFLGLPRLFPTLHAAAVWAETLACPAPAAGSISALLSQVGDPVIAGQPLARIATLPTETLISSPSAGVVARLLVAPGTRVQPGELIAELALPATLRVVVVLPPSASVAVGDRVSIDLLGDRRLVSGTIEQVLAANAPGPWTDNGTPPRRGLILLDPSPQPPSLGQGAHVTILGRDPSPFRLALLGLRRLLPW